MHDQPTIVLIHGLFGFRKLLWIEYFQGVRSLYESMGLRVIVPRLPPVGSLEQRAKSLALQLEDEAGPLHLVGHSMGGLDARYYINHLHGAEKVATLTTLVTPHRGSSVADYVCACRSPFKLLAGVRSLTTKNMQRFNARTADLPGVVYRSYSATRKLDEQPWVVRRYARYIQSQEGDNDSQVSIVSAEWGEHIKTLPCDHFELISKNLWLNPFRVRKPYNPMRVYRDIGEWVLHFEGGRK
ncbi:alpha/beta fold hydrolase [Mariprofundus sp. EBB-1]|uniref:esterase/lipase family protein n=1 Tax=Mariprofundus sp. EBB-1 TaxID=2650971 RepID=UPI000EF25AF0|nr:alpha/beta fold hydrolase [Mariprofundus sp. EBB-1]RLL53294.1 alpha/beta fold hydrolase [Mariprofundus sp. EBB-1]